MRIPALRIAAPLLAAVAIGQPAFADDTPEPYRVPGKVIQVLKAFDNPEGAIFSPDGRYVYISNAAELGNPEKGFHWTEKAGYVSKLAVKADGTLSMVSEKLVDGLTAPLGMAISTAATRRFPKGTIFLCAGAAPIAEADGTHIGDPSRAKPRMVAFNAAGKILGEIDMGAGSAFEKITGAVATLPNAADFDAEGNLYVADTGIAGAAFDPPVKTAPGVWKIPKASLDLLADGKDAPLQFIAMPEGGPDGLQIAPDGSIHTNTVGAAAGMKDPAAGGMYRLTVQDFEKGSLPAPFASNLGALDGLDFVGGVRLDTEIVKTNTVVVTIPFGKPQTLVLDPEHKFAGPADVAVRKQADGSWLLVVPELSATLPNNKDNAVTVIRLPADFERR